MLSLSVEAKEMSAKIKASLLNYQRDTYTNQDSLQLESERDYLDCALGTNPYGCSQDILQSPAPPHELFTSYPTPDPSFIHQLIKYWHDVVTLSEDNIQLEVGTFGVIERLNKLLIDEKSVVLGYCPQFADYRQDVLCSGGKFEYVSLRPENNYRFNASELVAALSPKFKLVYLDNPNNPTGQVIPLPEIETIVKAAESINIMVLVDEAYGDFMDKKDSSITLIPKYSNLFVARSFTKGFGLAGLRVGYVAMSNSLLAPYSLVAHPFPVTALGQYYAGLALEDPEFLTHCRLNITKTKQEIIATCTKLLIPTTHPSTPIMTLIHPEPDIDLYREFLKRYVITTSGEHFIGLGKNSVRLRIPKEHELIIDRITELNSF